MVHTLYQYEVEWVPSDTVKTKTLKILATPFITDIRLTSANIWRDLNCYLSNKHQVYILLNCIKILNLNDTLKGCYKN